VARGERPALFSYEWRTPLDVGDAAEALLELAERDGSGVLHVAGPERIDRARIALAALTSCGVPKLEARSRIEIVARIGRPGRALRPADASLDATKSARTARDSAARRHWSAAGVAEPQTNRAARRVEHAHEQLVELLHLHRLADHLVHARLQAALVRRAAQRRPIAHLAREPRELVGRRGQRAFRRGARVPAEVRFHFRFELARLLDGRQLVEVRAAIQRRAQRRARGFDVLFDAVHRRGGARVHLARRLAVLVDSLERRAHAERGHEADERRDEHQHPN
jgi:hypothetical protein